MGKPRTLVFPERFTLRLFRRSQSRSDETPRNLVFAVIGRDREFPGWILRIAVSFPVPSPGVPLEFPKKPAPAGASPPSPPSPPSREGRALASPNCTSIFMFCFAFNDCRYVPL